MSALSRFDRSAKRAAQLARREGEKARRQGRIMAANPYPSMTIERQSWDTGWRFENNRLTLK